MPTVSMFYGIRIYLYTSEHELLANWEIAQSGEAPFKIEPLR